MNRLINKTAIIFVTDVELNKEIYYEKKQCMKIRYSISHEAI